MGPLNGIKVIELKGIGPAPYATMLLADLGAEVITVERSRKPSGIGFPSKMDINCRGKKSIVLNLKTSEGLAALLKLVDSADMLVEAYRPGVAEKLGFGPDVCHARNPKLVYGRMTGWGQSGPLAHVAGHDINYISLTGPLAAIGGSELPVPPINLVGDYGGGSLFLVMGMLAALHVATQTGKGDVIDAAITDGTASLMSILHSSHALGVWNTKRQSNLFDGAAYFYRCYECADGKHVSIGSLEPQFYAMLIDKMGLDPKEFGNPQDVTKWPAHAKVFEAAFKTKTRDQWCEIMEGTDICFAPVLDFTEAPHHPHNKARNTYIEVGGITQPAPAPKFSNSVLDTPKAPPAEGQDTDQVLASYGFSDDEIAQLKAGEV